MEAFSDGVIAIIITIMVLELKVPHGTAIADLQPLIPVFLSYVLSFVYVGIYWNNHHHIVQTMRSISGPILWANLHLLFWLSLVPFVTGFIGENHVAAAPVALYGVVLLMCAIAFSLLTAAIVRHEGYNSTLAAALGKDVKGKMSIALYLLAIAVAFFVPILSIALYVIVAGIWFIPDRRVERTLGASKEPSE